MNFFAASDATTRFVGRIFGGWLSSIWNFISKPFRNVAFNPQLNPGDFTPTPVFQASPFKFLFFILILAFIALIVYILIRSREHKDFSNEFKQKHFIKPRVEEVRNTRWDKVQELFASPNEADWRLAIIEADNVLEEMLMHFGYQGESVGERLKQATPQSFPMLQTAWQAHLVRNRIAHEGLNYHLSHEEAWRVYKSFENVFRSMRYI
jgi:hypothetical protein